MSKDYKYNARVYDAIDYHMHVSRCMGTGYKISKGELIMRKVEKITVYFKNSFYGFDYWGYKTIKDLIDSEGIKKSQVNSFYKHYTNY
jgi:hypothetical protein